MVADAPPSIVNGHIDDAPRLVELSVIGVMFSDTVATGDARPSPAYLWSVEPSSGCGLV